MEDNTQEICKFCGKEIEQEDNGLCEKCEESMFWQIVKDNSDFAKFVK